ncbi:MAG: hypothetical protein COC04_03530 [Gammaproteobacteria bacterium]|nr:MAG: hypothetical protein COC04_03530 [Gammaproteobacteria bacterium]
MKTISFQLIWLGLLLLLTSNIVMGQRTSIVLGTEDWPPFSYADKANDQTSGLSTEIINATFRLMGISITENRVYPWARAQQLVYHGILDAVYTASINDERKEYCHFPSEPIVTSKWVLFIKQSKKEVLNFDELSDLKKKRIGLILGYNYPSTFKKYVTENSLISEVPFETQNIAMLIRGRFDYMPAVLETTLYLAKNRPQLKKVDAYNNLYYFPTPLATTNFYLMFSKKTVEKEFVDRFSKALIEFKKTDEYQKILKKYL